MVACIARPISHRTDWSFTRFYLQQAVDAGYRLVDDAQVLWEAFASIHNKAGLAGKFRGIVHPCRRDRAQGK